MPKKEQVDHHHPRKHDKKKHHRHGFSEDVQERRQARVGFKNYLRQIEEEELSAFEDDEDENL